MEYRAARLLSQVKCLLTGRKDGEERGMDEGILYYVLLWISSIFHWKGWKLSREFSVRRMVVFSFLFFSFFFPFVYRFISGFFFLRKFQI